MPAPLQHSRARRRVLPGAGRRGFKQKKHSSVSGVMGTSSIRIPPFRIWAAICRRTVVIRRTSCSSATSSGPGVQPQMYIPSRVGAVRGRAISAIRWTGSPAMRQPSQYSSNWTLYRRGGPSGEEILARDPGDKHFQSPRIPVERSNRSAVPGCSGTGATRSSARNRWMPVRAFSSSSAVASHAWTAVPMMAGQGSDTWFVRGARPDPIILPTTCREHVLPSSLGPTWTWTVRGARAACRLMMALSSRP